MSRTLLPWMCLAIAACGAAPTQISAEREAAEQLKKKKISVRLTPKSAQLSTGQSVQFAAAVTGSTNAAVSWSASGGTITASGLFTAGNTAGNYQVTATSAASSSASAQAAVSISGAPSPSAIEHVFVIALENQDASSIYGNTKAPYINGTLMKKYAYASHYGDDLPSLPSEPHYVYMEAGTNAFSDTTFKTDSDPSASNSTASTEHLVSLGIDSWMSYQEDMPASCPVKSVFPYAAKHDPFIFFRDVSFTNGKPDPSNTYCAQHHRDFSHLASDVSAGSVATYNFITPNLCNDMHGDSRCTNGCTSTAVGSPGCVSAGDNWLATNLPPLISFAEAYKGVIFIVWDEAEDTTYSPFLVVGPHLKAPGTASSVSYGHGSLVRSIAEIAQLPPPSTVGTVNDFSDFFTAGSFP